MFRRKPEPEPEPPMDGLYAAIVGNQVDGYEITVYDEGAQVGESEKFPSAFDCFPTHVMEPMARKHASYMLARERRRRATHLEDFVTV